jgi:hypothetical protein
MSNVTLSDGRKVTFDLYKCSLQEFRNLLDPGRPEEEGDAILGKITGMSAEEIRQLPYPDYRALVKGFFEATRNPLADPNLESVSTSD